MAVVEPGVGAQRGLSVWPMNLGREGAANRGVELFPDPTISKILILDELKNFEYGVKISWNVYEI